MALHRVDPNDPLKKYLVERPRSFLCGHGSGRRQLDHPRDRFPVAETVPGRHQGAPTLEQIAAPITAFDRALDAMPECCSTTSCGKLVVSWHQSFRHERKPCVTAGASWPIALSSLGSTLLRMALGLIGL